MDLLEKFSNKFGRWYEGLFGGGSPELRPKDVLRKIIAAMEDNRKEGLDGRVYVPNKYVVEFTFADSDERDYLLSFLDEEELINVLQRYMIQNKYSIRGPLDFTIADNAVVNPTAVQKLRIVAKFEKGAFPAPEPDAPPVSASSQPGPASIDSVEEDLPTVARGSFDDAPTVAGIAWAALAVTSPSGRKRHFSISKQVTSIGRSRSAGNDLLLDDDGMVSKAHARLEREADGRFTLYDLNSTNGVTVNSRRVSGNAVLREGDDIVIGETHLLFQQEADAPLEREAPVFSIPQAALRSRRAQIIDDHGIEHALGSETLIGRSITADIVIDHPSVSTKHARIVAPSADTYYLEDLNSDMGTSVNARRISPPQRALLTDGDRITVGDIALQFRSQPV